MSLRKISFLSATMHKVGGACRAQYGGKQIYEGYGQQSCDNAAQRETRQTAHRFGRGLVDPVPQPYHVLQFATEQYGVHQPEQQGGPHAGDQKRGGERQGQQVEQQRAATGPQALGLRAG